MTQAVPFAPARAIIKHLQGSKNRIARYAQEEEKIRAGLRELRAEVDKLHLELESSESQDTIPHLIAGFEAAIFSASSIITTLEATIRVERHFQHVMGRWLKGLAPLPRGGFGPNAPYDYIQSKAREVPTPEHKVDGHYEDAPALDAEGNHPSVQGRYIDPETGKTLSVVGGTDKAPAASAPETGALPPTDAAGGSSPASPQPVDNG